MANLVEAVAAWLAIDRNEAARILFGLAGPLATLVGFFLAAMGLWVNARQFAKNQDWKENEFLAAEFRRFYNDEDNRRAMTILDWSQRYISFKDENGNLKSELVNREVTRNALMPATVGVQFSRVESRVRDIFDHFFTEIELFERFIREGLVSEQQVKSYFKYWIDMLLGRKTDALDMETLRYIWAFLDRFGYDDVRALMERFGEVPKLPSFAGESQRLN